MASTHAFKRALRATLLADTSVVALISTRLYAIKVSAELTPTTPYVVMATVSGSGSYAHDGATGLDSIRLQFSIYAGTSEELEKIRDTLKEAMEGLAGQQLAAPIVQGETGLPITQVSHVAFENDVDTFESESTKLKTKAIDFRLMIRTIGS